MGESESVPHQHVTLTVGLRLAWAALCVTAVTGAFFCLFAWDHERASAGGGETSGPYSFWQVGVLLVVVLGLTVGATRRGMPLLVTLTIPLVLASWFAWDWARTDDSGLYSVGVIMLGVGSFCGVGLVALVARAYLAAGAERGTAADPPPG